MRTLNETTRLVARVIIHNDNDCMGDEYDQFCTWCEANFKVSYSHATDWTTYDCYDSYGNIIDEDENCIDLWGLYCYS